MGILNSALDRIRKDLSDLPASISQAAHDVLVERQRQVLGEGWTEDHDDDHTAGTLAKAGASYAMCAGVGLAHLEEAEDHYHFPDEYEDCEAPMPPWPFSLEWWKPSRPRRDLVKAAALIIAEIERIDRAESS